MTSLYDHYTSGLNGSSGSSNAALASSAGVVSLSSSVGRESQPMFVLKPMNIKLSQDIEHVVVANQTMVVHTSNVLLRIRFSPNATDPIETLPALPKSVNIVRMFLDPQGNHLLMTVMVHTADGGTLGALGLNGGGVNGGMTHELWYLHRSAREPKRFERYSGHEITAVGWNRAGGADAMTGAILLGTSRGVIFETELSCMPGDRRGASTVNWKQIFDIGKGVHCPINGLDFFKVANTGRHIVVVTTPTRLYTFHGDLRVDERYPYLHNIFAPYLNKPEQKSFEIPSSTASSSALRFIYETPACTYPRFYGWLNSAGLTFGEIDATAETPEILVPWPGTASKIAFPTDNIAPPLACELTDYHILFLYAGRLVAVSRLTHAIVHEENFELYGAAKPLLGLVRDQRAGITYLFSRKLILKVLVRDEQRNVWRQHLDRDEFALAKKAARNAAHQNLILIREGDVCFERAEFGRSAALYAESKAGFEAVCLKFMRDIGGDGRDAGATKRAALMVFVRQRLEQLKSSDKTQITMLVVWLVELYVAEMAMARTATGNAHDRRRRLQTDFDAFVALPRIAECMADHLNVFYGLMAAHGDTHNLAALTAKTGDHATVVQQHIEQGAYAEALNVLRALPAGTSPELFYQHAPVLMEELPRQTADVLRSPERRLDVERLLPALMCVETDVQRTEVMRFLEWSIHSMACQSMALHNYLIQLYAQWRTDRLMNYLNNQGSDVELVHYDVQFALRVCLQHEKCREPSVFLYCLLELWQPAVELALQFDALLAEKTASQTGDTAVRRQLWLLIAKHRIRSGDDVRTVLQVLHKCDGLLRIEDVLPHFDDFERIEHFKEAVIDALRQYNEELQRHREEMDESAKAAQLVRDELQTFRQRSVRIGAQEKCAVCRALLMLRPFFVFQCGHMFHGDCMETEVVKQMDPEKRAQLSALRDRMSVAQLSSVTDADNGRDRLKAEYEEMIAAECLFCGNYMIDCIDLAFGVADGTSLGQSNADDW